MSRLWKTLDGGGLKLGFLCRLKIQESATPGRSMDLHNRVLDIAKQIGCSMAFITICRTQVTDANDVSNHLCI